MYTVPSSAGEKARVEQKPSEEDIKRVRPSLDLFRQVSDHVVGGILEGGGYQVTSVKVA